MSRPQPWTEHDIATLKKLAGTVHRTKIAEELGRSVAATDMQASKHGISLKVSRAAKAASEGDAERNQGAGQA